MPFAFVFNNKLLLIESVNPSAPNDPKSIVWIINPAEIAVIFTTALVGMFAFSSAMQGYFLTRVNLLERFLLLLVAPLVMVPNICAQHISFISSEYVSYVYGIGLYALIFVFQKIKSKSIN